MNLRRLFFSSIGAVSILSCNISCADTDDADGIVTMQENVKNKTNKPSSPFTKEALSKASSGTSKSESAREADSTDLTEIQETREPRRLLPDTGTDPGTGTDPETIDPTKPDRPK